MTRYVIKGRYWRAGDNIYIDTQNEDMDLVIVCLNDFIKENIDEETKVTVTIDVEK